MRFVAHVEVSLKPGLLDPQGKAIEGSLPALGWSNVSGVRVGKYVRLELEARDHASATAQVDEMSRRLLSNPVIEDIVIHDVTEDGGLATRDGRA
jgi:phosphoribosylformylglycinamidine synthase PurS subunit